MLTATVSALTQGLVALSCLAGCVLEAVRVPDQQHEYREDDGHAYEEGASPVALASHGFCLESATQSLARSQNARSREGACHHKVGMGSA